MKYFLLGFLAVGVITGSTGCQGTVKINDGRADAGDTDTTDATEEFEIDNGISWVEVGPGSFLMGSPETEWGRDENEYMYEVHIVHSYEISATETTCAQWRALGPDFEDECDEASVPEDIPRCTDDDCPVAVLSPDRAKQWLDALSSASGLQPCYRDEDAWPTPLHCQGYRLPTEAEWEYAARAGDQRATYNGDLSPGFGIEQPVLESIAYCEGEGSTWQERSRAQPVALLDPNALGLYDIIGNLAELTLWQGVYPEGPATDPVGDSETSFHAMRGGHYGSWYFDFKGCRAASRDVVAMPSWKPSIAGLRPVRTLDFSGLPEPEFIDPCPSLPAAACPWTSGDLQPLLHPAPADGRYVDLTDGESTSVVLLGETGETGSAEPFVEILSFDGESEVPDSEVHGPAPTLQATAAVAATTLTNEGLADSVVTLLCEGSSCFLAELEDIADPLAELTPVAAGSVPQWIAVPSTLIRSETRGRFFVAGDGIASFDGSAWREEIAAGTGGSFLALVGRTLPGIGDVLAAAGRGGRIAVSSGEGWFEPFPPTGEDLLFIDVYNFFWNEELRITAVGAGGAFVDGPAQRLIECRLGDRDLRLIMRSPDRGAFLVVDDRGKHVYKSGVERAERICWREDTPAMLLDAMVFPCGIIDNYFFLSATGLYGYYPFCAID